VERFPTPIVKTVPILIANDNGIRGNGIPSPPPWDKSLKRSDETGVALSTSTHPGVGWLHSHIFAAV
jgi:hypothetical protein